MIISYKYKFIFICVPKTGTSSIEDALLKLSGSLNNTIWNGNAWVKVSTHIAASKLKRYMPEEDWLRMRKFAFVRHPIDRYISAYWFYKTGRVKKEINEGVKFPIRVHINHYLARHLPFPIWLLLHPFKSSACYLTDDAGFLLVDYVGHYEELSTEYMQIMNHLDIPIMPLPWLNKSHGSKLWRESKICNAIVKIKHKLDFSIFNYSNNVI